MLRELCHSTRGSEVEVTGERIDWPETAVVPEDAVSVALPKNFTVLLAQATPVVDRQETRQVLQGINLSQDGIVATTGKLLLHLPFAFDMREDVTLPFL